GESGNGIEIDDGSSNGSNSPNNKIQGNFIGTNADGSGALGNVNDGILLVGADSTQIGGTASGQGNLISGNGGNGIETAGPAIASLVAKKPGSKIANTQPTSAKTTTKPSGTKTSSTKTGSPKTNSAHVAPRQGQHNVIQGNLIGTDATGTKALPNATFFGRTGIYLTTANNLVGGTTSGAGNLISGNGVPFNGNNGNIADGIRVESSFNQSAAGNTIQGNSIGINLAGNAALPNTGNGILLNAPTNTVGGTAGTAHNIISGNAQAGIKIQDSFGNNNTILGNFIGTDITGVSAIGNGAQGILINGATNTVGGTANGAENVIAGNGSQGIAILKFTSNSADGNIIQGNFIGLNVNSATLPNGNDGITISSNNNTVGGTAAGAGNTIAFNTGNGVNVLATDVFSNVPVGNVILGNSIFSNTKLGIDLGNDGVTANDLGAPPDADTGANNLQNFPALTTATTVSGNTTITGSLDSTPSTNFRIEFFSNAAADSSGFGEGQNLLGSKNVITDANGHIDFSATLNGVALSQGQVVTSTATRLDINSVPIETSEFSQAVAAAFADLSIANTDNPDPVDAGGTLTYTLTVTNNGPDAANNVTVVDTLPTGVSFGSATGTGWTVDFNDTTNQVTLARASLAKGTAPAITITVTAPSEGGSLTNTATVSSSPGDPDLSNNTAAQTTT
ncbi:MAG: DUF11 domain-containing protein, partial [Abitibacteriaceae bacterium]|nr:DUF11 domain-containing protein [Abditibacteriaceae bacterium]